MPFLTDAERDDLRIDRMIFHVVGPDLDDPVLLAEFDPPIFTEFFLGRVKSALGGNAYRFRPDSPTMATLREIGGDDAAFVDGSERLAQAFQHEHRKNSIDGVFFLFLLSTAEDRQLFALVKYDNDQVLNTTLPTVTGSGARSWRNSGRPSRPSVSPCRRSRWCGSATRTAS